MMIGINIYIGCRVKKFRAKWYRGRFCKTYGPLICSMVAAPLILADLFRHVAQDQNLWPECDRQKLFEDGKIYLTDLPYSPNVASLCQWSSGQFACEFPSKKYLNTTEGVKTPFPKDPYKSANFTCADQAAHNFGCVTTCHENMAHLSFIGILFTIFFTYTGFTFLMVGVLWDANIMDKCGKIKKTWQDMRGQMRQQKSDAPYRNIQDARTGV